MSLLLSRPALMAVVLGCASSLAAQALPTSQPALLTIVREDVKIGREADHAKFEAGWPAAYAKAKSPVYYLALVSMTGPNEAWYIVPAASHAQMDDAMKRETGDAALSTELERLGRGDSEFITNRRVIQAAGRPDLSMGAFPDLAKARFTEVTWFRVRPGREADFEAAAKAYRTAAQRSAPATSYRIYEVIAGVPGPTYLIFASVNSYSAFDEMMAAGQATMRGANAEEMSTLQKFFTEGLINFETQRFRVDPAQSYVSAETRATDPAFWSPKKLAARP